MEPGSDTSVTQAPDGTCVGAAVECEPEPVDWHKLYLESEAKVRRLNSVMVELGDGLVVLDSDLQYRYVNDYTLQLMGRTEEEVLGKSFYDLYPDLIATPFERALKTTLREQRQTDADVFYPSNGRYWRTTISPTDTGLTIFFRDVTELKAIETAQQRLAAIIESSDDAIIGKTLDGIITDWNPAAERIFGYTAEEIIGKPKTTLFPPDRLEEEVVILARLRQNIPTDHFETIRVRKDGTQLHVSLTISPIRDSKGHTIGASTIARDITERKQLVARLREETETVETIHRLGQRLSAELDLEKLVQAATDACTQLTGAQFGAFFYNVVNTAGESYLLYTLSGVPREAFAQFPLPRNTAVFAPTFMGTETVRLDDVTKDPRYGKNAPYHGMPPGHLPVTSYLAVPVVSRSGEVLGGLFFGHPQAGMFTQRHELIVEGLAAQAAIAVDNARLFQAERERSKQLTLSIQEVHHRVKNNLQSVSALLEMQIDPASSVLPVDAVQDSLSQIKTIALVHDLLTHDKPMGHVDATQVLTRLIPLLSTTIGTPENPLPIRLDAIPVQIPVRAATALALVINELVNNAAKHFVPPSGKESVCHDASIQIRLQQRQEEIHVSVQDNGPGFPPGFDPARDAHIGLELVQTLVTHDLKGSISFYNRVGSNGSQARLDERGAGVGITFIPGLLSD